MVLLHQNDIHFDLVVSRESDLGKMGSLSYRFNVGPSYQNVANEKDENVKQTSTCSADKMDVHNSDGGNKDSIIKDLKRKLKESEDGKKVILTEYLKCEIELRVKIEETAKLRQELKDLKEIANLSKELKETHAEMHTDDEESKVEEVPVENFVKKKVTSPKLNTGPGSKSSSLKPKSGNKEK